MSVIDTIVGVPIDCTGRFAGCERLPAALRASGLAEGLGVEDRGNLQATIADPVRDPATGIVGFGDAVAASGVIRDGIRGILESGRRPLVLGGCCTLLIGAVAAARAWAGRVGLTFVDGHLDFYDGASSPTGEAAEKLVGLFGDHQPEHSLPKNRTEEGR